MFNQFYSSFFKLKNCEVWVVALIVPQLFGSLNQTINIVQFVFHSMKDVVPAQEVCMFPCIHDSNSLPICLILFETMSVNAEFFEAPNPHGSMACTRHVYDKICVCALQTYSWVWGRRHEIQSRHQSSRNLRWLVSFYFIKIKLGLCIKDGFRDLIMHEEGVRLPMTSIWQWLTPFNHFFYGLFND